MRSVFAVAAAVFFGYNALAFMPVTVYLNEGALGGIDGEPGAVAVTYAARTLFAGLALLSLALVDWSGIARSLRSFPSDT